VPLLTDKASIRSLLLRDRPWSVYALGDLTPRMFEKCLWFTPDLSLVLRDYGTSILFAMGSASVVEALDHVTWPVHLQVQKPAFDAIARVATIERVWQMWRMTLTSRAAVVMDPQVTRLCAADVGALERLYADGESTGESPDFFHASMVTDGVFFGLYENGELTAAAGTHLVARDEGAAAIGNVYTRRDCRGRGRGRLVTSAVVRELSGIETIALNVRADNHAAIRVYQSLGFSQQCEFYEGLATGRHA
jgi:ribosomal protein S18 acetylase RimI-like enzyme